MSPLLDVQLRNPSSKHTCFAPEPTQIFSILSQIPLPLNPTEIEIICFESSRPRHLALVAVSVVENGRLGAAGGEGALESALEEGALSGLSVVASRLALGLETAEELAVLLGIVGLLKVGSKGAVTLLAADSTSGGAEGARAVEVADLGGAGETEGRDVLVVKVAVLVLGVVGNGSAAASAALDAGVGAGDVGSLLVPRSSAVGAPTLSTADGGLRDVVENA